MRTLWLKNKLNETWDLMARKITLEYNTFAYNLNDFASYEDDVGLNQVSSNFVVDSRTPQGKELSCTLIFASHKHIRMFNEFIRDLSDLRLCYDPTGLILPETQIANAWYKPCAFVGMGIHTKGSHRMFECEVNFNFLTSKWQKDTVLSSYLMGVEQEALQFNFVYPFFFYTGNKIGLKIKNNNDETSCRVDILNKGTTTLNKCAWTAYYDDGTMQNAEWMAGQNKLQSKRRLIVDSEPGNEQAYVETSDGNKEIVTRDQAIGTKYDNYITIKHGDNTILFDFGRTTEIDIQITYKEQVRMGLI